MSRRRPGVSEIASDEEFAFMMNSDMPGRNFPEATTSPKPARLFLMAIKRT